MQDSDRLLTERPHRLAQGIGESRTAGGLGREKLAQRRLPHRGGAAQQMRQARFALKATEITCDIEPIPALLDGIVRHPSVQLIVQEMGGMRPAEFGERLNLDGVLQSGPETGLSLLPITKR